MKKIFIGFSDGKTLFSTLIKLATWSKTSHSFIGFRTKSGEDLVFQASGLTVNYENYDHFITHVKITDMFSKEVSDEEWKHMKQLQLKEMGTHYGWKEIIGFVYVLAARSVGIKVKNPFFDGDRTYICVESTLEQLNEKWDGYMTPEDLRLWCKNNPSLKQESLYIKTFE